MDFDQMLETWRAQNTAPSYDVNRDALRQALQTEEVRVREDLRTRRRELWFVWIFYGGMAVWAVLWIANSIANGWSAIYVITAVVSLGLFALGVGTVWVSRRRKAEPKRSFGNTLEEEVRRNLALLDAQLSITRYAIIEVLGAVSLVVGTLLFSWTVNRSPDDLPDLSGSGGFIVLLVGWIVWVFYSGRKQMRQAKPELELRQRRLRELLASLEARE
jgi:hypothetical protein